MSSSKFRKTLSPKAIDSIHEAVESLFSRIKQRLMGGSLLGKRITITTDHDSFSKFYSLPGMYQQAARVFGAPADPKTLHQVLKVAESYVDSTKERLKARSVAEVQKVLGDTAKDSAEDFKTALQGALVEVNNKTQAEIRKIVEAELNHAKNLGSLEGIIRINSSLGIEDPVVYFATVPDKARCLECERLHLLEDGITPRVWKLSEVGTGYHKMGDPNPKTSGLHPHCRCSQATLLPGWGFKDGRVTYISAEHDEFKAQRE